MEWNWLIQTSYEPSRKSIQTATVWNHLPNELLHWRLSMAVLSASQLKRVAHRTLYFIHWLKCNEYFHRFAPKKVFSLQDCTGRISNPDHADLCYHPSGLCKTWQWWMISARITWKMAIDPVLLYFLCDYAGVSSCNYDSSKLCTITVCWYYC